MAQPSRLAGIFGVVLGALLLPACATTRLPADPPKAPAERAAEAREEESTPRARLQQDIALSRSDHGQFYSLPGLASLALGIAAAAPLANTDADEDVRQWYQRNRHDELDAFATLCSVGGQAWVAFPLGLEVARILGHLDEESYHDGGLMEWSNRSLRSVALGYPPVVALYGLLGASRPNHNDSSWHPFEDFHGVSGHTFIGAVPFLTAAVMTDNYLLRAPLVLGSFLTGWSRIHDDRHYLSQVVLGWGIAALTVWSVDRTQEAAPWSITPTVGPAGPGVALEMRY